MIIKLKKKKRREEWTPRRIPNFLFLKKDEITQNGNYDYAVEQRRRSHQVSVHERNHE